MAITKLDVALKSTTLGTNTPNEGVSAIVYGVKTASSKTLSGVPKRFTSYDQYNTWVTASPASSDVEYLIASNAVEHLSAIMRKFYDKVSAGAPIWLILVDAGANGNGDFVTSNSEIIKGQIYHTIEGNFNNRPRLIGYVSQADDLVEDAEEVPNTLETMVKAVQEVHDDIFAESFRTVGVVASSCRASKLLDGDITTNFASYLASSVYCLLTTSAYTGTGTTADPYVPMKDVGEVLGVMASISVAQSIGSCGLPPVATKAFFNLPSVPATDGGDLVSVSLLTTQQANDLGEQQIGFHRTRKQLDGVYYNDGATCIDATKSLSKIEYNRLGNSVCDDAEFYFQRIINTQLPVDVNGNLSSMAATQLENSFYNEYAAPRISAGQASSISVTVAGDGFASNNTLKVEISIQPSPNVEQVFVYVFYVTSQS